METGRELTTNIQGTYSLDSDSGSNQKNFKFYLLLIAILLLIVVVYFDKELFRFFIVELDISSKVYLVTRAFTGLIGLWILIYWVKNLFSQFVTGAVKKFLNIIYFLIISILLLALIYFSPGMF